MPPIARFIRIPAGWLAIPASLFMVIGCTSTEPVEEATAHHALIAHELEGSPFEQVFTGQADVVVLTFYDLYCVACQQSAENFTVAYRQIKTAFPDESIQITGIGLGDTEFELSVFQRKYALPYDSLPDPDKSFEQPFSLKGTPTVLAFKRKDGSCVEIYRHEGRFRSNDIEILLERIRQSVSASSPN